MTDNEKVTPVQAEENSPKEKELGMGWHEILLVWYFIIGWGGIIVSIATVILGIIALEPSGIVGGLLALGVAALMLVTRKKLSDLDHDAIYCLKAMYVARFVLTLVDVFLAYGYGSPSYKIDFKELIFDLLRLAIFCAINLSYYKRREDMFLEDEDDD